MITANSIKTYIKSNETIGSLRADFILALIPAIIWSFVHFGLKALITIIISIASVSITDLLLSIITDRKLTKPTAYSVFCAVLFAMTLYSDTSLILCIVGAALIPLFFRLFGGEGKCSFFIPIISREIANLLVPNGMNTPENLPINSIISETIPEENVTELILGLRAGMLGSISILAVLLGALYLIFRKSADFKVTAAYVVSFAALSLAFPAIEARAIESTLYEFIASDLLFVAFFILTDYSSTPSNAAHRYIKGVACAVLTFLLRTPEATYNAYFIAIIVVDMLSPLFNTAMNRIKIAKEISNAE